MRSHPGCRHHSEIGLQRSAVFAVRLMLPTGYGLCPNASSDCDGWFCPHEPLTLLNPSLRKGLFWT